MALPGLSKRLAKIAELAEGTHVLADVGTDHALLPIWLVMTGKIQSAILTDVNDGPLKTASSNIGLYGADRGKFDLRKGDGLKPLKQNEADVIAVCGMGGNLIAEILKNGGDKAKNARLILEPNTCWDDLRRFLCENGYVIDDEITLAEGNHPYLIIVSHYDGIVRQMDDYYLGDFVSKMDNEYKRLLIKKSEAVLSHVDSEFHRKVVKKLK